MSKRNEAVSEGNGKHGSLDADASARLDALLEAAALAGFDVDAGAMMSRAIRFYHGSMCGRVQEIRDEIPDATSDPPKVQ